MSEKLHLPAQQATILSFAGPDAIRFLNGQITQDVSNLGDNALSACVTDAKGRLQYFIHVFVGPESDSLWITCPKKQSDGLRDRLERYLIADEVEVEDLTDRWACIQASYPDPSPAFTRKSRNPFGEGFDWWWKPGELPQLESITAAEAERRRIVERIPAWGSELSEGMLPPEAGLDRTSISYNKGCYIGQEVLSRIKSAGKLNRRLGAFEIEGSAEAGDLLLLDSKEVGQLTSCAQNPGEGETTFAALGYLKKKGFEASEFAITDSSGEVRGLAKLSGWA